MPAAAVLELKPPDEVDAGPRACRVDAVLDVAALGLDVGLVRSAGACADVEIARGRDHDFREDGAAALLALEEHTAHRAPVEDRGNHPRVQEEPHPGFGEEVGGNDLEPLRVDHGRPGDRVTEGAQALAPVGHRVVVRRAPELGGAPAIASSGSRSRISDAKPVMT